jgi:muconate cycloisomerase
MKSLLRQIRATPVVVPAKPDSLNSPGIEDDDPKFRDKFKTGKSWDDFANQVKWIVEIETAAGLVGIGETYRSVPRAELETALRAFVGCDVMRLDWRRLPVANPRIYDALESAVLDLVGKLLDVPVHQLLGGAGRDRIECSGWTGRRTPEDAARKAREAMERGHRVFKFKCSDTDPIREWCAKIQEVCGDRIQLLLDPNQRWNDVATTQRLMEGVPRQMMYGLEDPIQRQDYKGFHDLRESLGIPLFVHVSLPYLHQGQRAQDVLAALREGSADGFNFNGPMFGFLRLAGIAELAGLPCWHGSEVDLGILEVSALHACSACPNCTIPSDIFGELVRSDDLIEPGIRFDRGFAEVPRGAGLGVELDRGALERFQCESPVVL